MTYNFVAGLVCELRHEHAGSNNCECAKASQKTVQVQDCKNREPIYRRMQCAKRYPPDAIGDAAGYRRTSWRKLCLAL